MYDITRKPRVSLKNGVRFTSSRLVQVLPVLFFLHVYSPVAAATPPIVPPASLKGAKFAMPVSLESIMKNELVGLDKESKADRERILNQAKTYIELRSGKMSRDQAANWLAACLKASSQRNKKPSRHENPFCTYEISRKESSPRSRPRRTNRTSVRSLLKAIEEGKFDKANEFSLSESIAAVNYLDTNGQIDDIAKRVADSKFCVPSKLTYALGYKVEERFPDPNSVELAKRLYKSSSNCAQDLASAQASFRLGLIHIWQNQCSPTVELMKKVEAVAEASAYHSRAKYWRYHCATGKSQKAARNEIRESLLKYHPLSFHTLVISVEDEALMNELLQRQDPQVALRSVVRPDLNSLLRASEALARAGSPHLAAEMIDRNVNEISSLEPGVRLYVGAFLNRIGYALPSFKVLGALFHDVPSTVTTSTLRLYFPLWYFEDVKSRAEDVDPLLILSLIRQESAFNTRAHSPAGARGLMQVMPQTARSVASVSARQLFNPSINIKVGSKYFMKRLRQYDGDVEYTLAAYNAGFTRVDQWKKRYPTDNKMLFLDFIPFRETRDYVSLILRNYFWYVSLYELPQSTTDVMTADARETRTITSPITKIMSIVNANAGHAAASKYIPQVEEAK